MTSFSDDTHVFIVRIWQEKREIESAPPEYRGSIEHVPSGNKGYFRDSEKLLAFIQRHVPGWGITRSS